MISSTLNWLNAGESLQTSPLGRELNFRERCVRFTTIERTSLLCRATAFAIQAVGIAVLAAPLVATTLAATHVYLSTAVLLPSIVYTVGFFGHVGLGALFILTLGKITSIAADFYEPFLFGRKLDEAENALRNAIGSKATFDALPKMDEQKRNDIYWRCHSIQQEHLHQVKASDVMNPLTFGMESNYERLFLCLRVKEKGAGATGGLEIITLYSHRFPGPGWFVSPKCHNKEVQNYGNRGGALGLATRIISGQHPDFELA